MCGALTVGTSARKRKTLSSGEVTPLLVGLFCFMSAKCLQKQKTSKMGRQMSFRQLKISFPVSIYDNPAPYHFLCESVVRTETIVEWFHLRQGFLLGFLNSIFTALATTIPFFPSKVLTIILRTSIFRVFFQ